MCLPNGGWDAVTPIQNVQPVYQAAPPAANVNRGIASMLKFSTFTYINKFCSTFGILRVLLGFWLCVACIAIVAWGTDEEARPHWREDFEHLGSFQDLTRKTARSSLQKTPGNLSDLEGYDEGELEKSCVIVSLDSHISVMPCSKHFRSRLGSNFGSDRLSQAAQDQYSIRSRPKAA